jgi:hypothetical protein
MNWNRKGALLLLAVVVFWAAMPASACLLGARQASVPDCCRATVGCDSPGMGADSSCCEIQGKGPAIPPVQSYSPVQSLETASLPPALVIQIVADLSAGYGNTLETPPPKFPPGGAFALRI